jgi:hypothetical protein
MMYTVPPLELERDNRVKELEQMLKADILHSVEGQNL